MTSPGAGSQIETLRPDLEGLFEELDIDMNLQGMIAMQVFAPLEAGLQAGPFGKVKIESLMKAVDTKRGSGGTYNESSFEFEDDTYATKENGVAIPVDHRNKAIYANYFDAEAVAARLARHTVMLNMERRVAAKLFDVVSFTPTSAAVNWDTLATAKPIDDVEGGVQRLYAKGIIANALVLSWKRFRQLRNSEQVIDRIVAAGAGKPAKPEEVTLQMLAAVFDLPYILVGKAQYNTAKEGQNATLESVWNNELVGVTRVAPPLSDISQPCFGRLIHWGGDGSSLKGTLESYYDPNVRGDKVRCRMETDEKVMYTRAVELIDTTP